ncbi:MAG: c-type cytochrome [Acidobacteria bacterium]|nr:c-type cytochrome [Acidobacteriota bacterium]
MRRYSLKSIPRVFAALSLAVIFGNTNAVAQQGGVYTAAQAKRGQALYQANCAACHGQSLEGASASALKGSRFMAKWAEGEPYSR